MHKFSRLLLIPFTFLITSCSSVSPSQHSNAESTVIPIRLVGANPVIEVRVNGLPVNVHFDIGTGGSLALFPAQLDLIEDKTQVDTTKGGMAQDGPTGGGRPIYRVDQIEIGSLAIEDARIGEDFHDGDFQEEFATRLDAYGFLGRGFLQNHKVVIDYPQNELTIIPPDAPAAQQYLCRGIELALVEGKNWGLVSNAMTDLGEVVLVWDTGAPESIVFKTRTDRDRLGYVEGHELFLDGLSIAGHDFGPRTFWVWDWGVNTPPFDGFIGHDFFADHVVCVDFPNNRIFVQE